MSKNIEKQLMTKEAGELYEAFSEISDKETIGKFLRDLLTFDEIKEAINRFQVAKMLSEGKPMRQIAKETGVSTATIVRVNYWLHHGTGGYLLALGRLK